jgi:hypothetical protein
MTLLQRIERMHRQRHPQDRPPRAAAAAGLARPLAPEPSDEDGLREALASAMLAPLLDELMQTRRQVAEQAGRIGHLEAELAAMRVRADELPRGVGETAPGPAPLIQTGDAADPCRPDEGDDWSEDEAWWRTTVGGRAGAKGPLLPQGNGSAVRRRPWWRFW